MNNEGTLIVLYANNSTAAPTVPPQEQRFTTTELIDFMFYLYHY